ncbi:putative choline transporter, neither null mutation nor overexpression affects choline transport [Entomortierella chlamydospora]|uniref:Protein PNS1 n=1 Tax=Entomortierella chlamydospora TaxID=101097 RepID=A0A9P6T1J1_9FUNG|nr:putative choline transporter, neither null mutation nor overexpression affects choline transport [Entomortierella chlamydospora]
MSAYPPPNQPYPQHQYPPALNQQYQYGAQPPPQYQPLIPPEHQWGLQPQPGQQHFAPPMPPSYDGTVNPETGLPSKFNPKPKYNDLWALFVFLIQLAGFVVLSYFAITTVKNDGTSGPLVGFFSKSGLITLCISIGVGAVFSVVYFLLTQAFPRAVIMVTFALSILAYLAVALYYIYLKLCVMLQTVTSISKEYPATFVVAFLFLFLQIVYSIYFMVVIAGTYDRFYNTATGSAPATLYVLLIFSLFSFYWTSQVLANIAHTTICGVYATYYFMKGSPQGVTKSPTVESMKRACTTSIGSICFGSLIIAIIQTLRAIANIARNDGNGIVAFIGCLIDCLLACIQGLAEYVNKYAFAQVAIYGKPYIEAAKDTWTIIQDRGIEQIINDNLIGNVWGMAGLLGGILSAVGSYIYLRFATPAFNSNGQFTYAIIIVGFVMGLQIVFTVGTVIDSGVVTTFVCLAEDPAALARTKPELFEKIRATWPQVVQGIHY